VKRYYLLVKKALGLATKKERFFDNVKSFITYKDEGNICTKINLKRFGEGAVCFKDLELSEVVKVDGSVETIRYILKHKEEIKDFLKDFNKRWVDGKSGFVRYMSS